VQDLATRSFWLGLDPYTPSPPLAGEERCDVAILGGGFTGLWTAYLLLKENPGIRVRVLEANAVGWGASGRNGGFAMALVHRTLAELAGSVGDVEARRTWLVARHAVAHVAETVRAEGIACDLEATGLLGLSTHPVQDRAVELEVETAQRLGLGGFSLLDGATLRERLRSERIRCGFREDLCLLLNPARLVRGLKSAVEALGGHVHEGTTVSAWEEGDDAVEIHTPRGRLRADRALAAGNAWAATWQATRDTVLPFYSYVCLTRPLRAAEWESVGWSGREGVEDRRPDLHYCFRPTADGRILWGGRDPVLRPDSPSEASGPVPRPAYDREATFRHLREAFEWFFPQLAEVPFEHVWGGPIAVTASLLPAVGFVDEARRRVAFAHGYNGHGVAISNLAAHVVVDLFAGRATEWSELSFVGRGPAGLGPHFVRDPLERITLRALLRAEDGGAPQPLALRALERLTRSEEPPSE
jgi:glycine/D-amino acid oxidase-like deaminating enzyme